MSFYLSSAIKLSRICILTPFPRMRVGRSLRVRIRAARAWWSTDWNSLYHCMQNGVTTETEGQGSSMARVLRPRQLRLFPPLENPLTRRFGRAFFQALPRQPGVYFFHDAQGRLLYVGQSCDLRARLGSYRHVCATAAAAVAEEARLLLEHRPPFNRAGVWKGEPWYLLLQDEGQAETAPPDLLRLHLLRGAAAGALGPLPAGFRRMLPLFLRALLRLEHPGWRLTDFPCGLMGAQLPLELTLRCASASMLRQGLARACTHGPASLHAALISLPPPAGAAAREFWQEEAERLEKLGAKWLMTEAG